MLGDPFLARAIAEINAAQAELAEDNRREFGAMTEEEIDNLAKRIAQDIADAFGGKP